MLRWSVLLNPKGGNSWALLASAEADRLDRTPPSDRGLAWREAMQRALLIADRGMELTSQLRRVWDVPCLAKGRILIRLGRLEEARAVLRIVIGMYPSHALAWRLLAEAGERPPPRPGGKPAK